MKQTADDQLKSYTINFKNSEPLTIFEYQGVDDLNQLRSAFETYLKTKKQDRFEFQYHKTKDGGWCSLFIDFTCVIAISYIQN